MNKTTEAHGNGSSAGNGLVHHLDDATIMAYAAGTLDEALSVVAASHIAMCPVCFRAVRDAELIGAALLEGSSDEPVEQDAVARLVERLDEPLPDYTFFYGRALPNHARNSALPKVLARYLDTPLDQINWTVIAPGVSVHELPVSNAATGKLRLLRIAAGKAMPDHGHGGAELTLVLEGAYTDCFGRFAPGDVADLDPEADHKPIVEPEQDCICLIASEAPMRYKSIIGRVLQPVFGI